MMMNNNPSESLASRAQQTPAESQGQFSLVQYLPPTGAATLWLAERVMRAMVRFVAVLLTEIAVLGKVWRGDTRGPLSFRKLVEK